VNCLKNKFKIDSKTAPTCFGAVRPLSGSALLVLANVTVVKIVNYNTSMCGDVAVYISESLLVCTLHCSEADRVRKCVAGYVT
jgi:hypothetical protein